MRSRSLPPLGVITFLLGSLLAWSSPCAVRAQGATEAEIEAEARAHFNLANSHYELGHFAEAAAELEIAYSLSQRPALLYNIYVAHRDARQSRQAADALRRYLELSNDVENAPLLRARLAALEEEIRTGSAPEGTVEAATVGPEAGPIQATPSPPPPARSPGSHPSPLGWGVLGAGAAVVIAGAIAGGIALSEYSALEARCGAERLCPPGFESARDSGAALALTADVLLVGGAIIAASGLVLLFTVTETDTPPPPVSGTAFCTTDGCAAAIVGRM